MGKVGKNSLHDPVAGVGVAESECFQMITLGFLIVFLLVVDDSEFGVDERI